MAPRPQALGRRVRARRFRDRYYDRVDLESATPKVLAHSKIPVVVFR
jgi:hypothetical protein